MKTDYNVFMRHIVSSKIGSEVQIYSREVNMETNDTYEELQEYFFTYSETIDLLLGQEILEKESISQDNPPDHIAYYFLELLENVKADSQRALLALSRLCFGQLLFAIAKKLTACRHARENSH